MVVAGLLLRGYHDPRGAMAQQLMRAAASRSPEGLALVYLVAACLIGAIATLPRALDMMPQLAGDARAGVVPAHLFGYLFVAPLIGYGMAALIHGLARAFGGRAAPGQARLATFWSLLLGAPLAMILGAVRFAIPQPGFRLVVIAATAYWLWLAAASLAEAEGFTRTSRVAVVMVGVLLALVAGLTALSNGALLAR